jgi:peptidyl-prolyl cis-trans isomerase SurA
MPGVLSSFRGEITLQVVEFSHTRLRFAVVALGIGTLLAVGAGCHRAPTVDVMATVNGKDIFRAELEKSYNDFKASQGESPQERSLEQSNIERLNILQQLIEEEIMQQQAAKINLVASDDEVNAKLTEFKALSTQEEFDKTLKARNETLDDVKRDIRRNITETKLLNKEIDAKINITDTEISNYYNQHKSEFNQIEPAYHLARIVVTAAPSQQVNNLQNSKASSEADAKKKIQNLRNRLDSGEAFATVAASFSEDRAASSNGGDLGFTFETPLRTSAPSVFAAISKLKAGQSTDILTETDGEGAGRRVVGYSIYMLIEKRPAGQRNLSDASVQQMIRQGLRNSHAQLLKSAYYEVLHDQSKIRNYFAEQVLKQGAQ